MSVAKLRVLLADDHNVVRAGIRTLIDAQADMEVVAEAAKGEATCRLASELAPDVVVMHVSMPVLSGTRATEQIRRKGRGTYVLALTVHEDRGYLQQLIQAGASGYLLKRAAADDLIHAIRTVARGGTYLDPGLAGKVLGGMVGRTAEPTTHLVHALSDRERRRCSG